MRTLYGALVASVALVLSGCLSDGHDPDGPSRSDQSTGIPAGPDTGAPEFRATWDPLNALLPYPNDIAGFYAARIQDPTFVSDGTLAVPDLGQLTPLAGVVNQLDGFSTTSSISANFAQPSPGVATGASAPRVPVRRRPLQSTYSFLRPESYCLPASSV